MSLRLYELMEERTKRLIAQYAMFINGAAIAMCGDPAPIEDRDPGDEDPGADPMRMLHEAIAADVEAGLRSARERTS